VRNAGDGPSPLEHELFRELALDRFGLDLPAQRRGSIALRLRPRLAERGLSTYAEYYRLLRTTPDGSEEWGQFADAVTNAETYFFRGRGQLDELASLVPRMGRRLRVLSVGCASGEEAYGLAAVLAAQRADFDVVGADISTPRLADACVARYSARSFRGPLAVPGGGRFDSAFERDGDTYVPRSALRARVTFQRANLGDPGGLHLGRFDIVFCRNVLIYAHASALQRFLQSLAGALAPDGYLFLGETEALVASDIPFTARRLQRHFAYVPAS
jgi:chemotaxis protein methyltransferase CheR